MKRYIIFFLCLLLLACGRWKTTKLKPDQLCLIGAGESPGNIRLSYDNDDILEISFKILINNNIITADNILKRVQVLSKNGEPKMYIGEKKVDLREKNNIGFSKFQFSIIKDIAFDSNANIYIQNSFSSVRNPNDSGKRIYSTEIGFSPSYILIFDEKGTLIYTLGKTGSPDIPFNSIEGLKIDKQDRLFVISRSYDIWTIFRFVNRKRDFSTNFTEIDFKEADGDNTLIVKLEKIIIYDNGNEILIPVAYYNKTDFKYRKLFHYSIETEKIDKILFTIPDPKNEVFAIINDKLIYLWDMDDSNIRFMITNLEGNIVNNLSIELPDSNKLYNDIVINEKGQIYTYHTLKNGIKIIEWR